MLMLPIVFAILSLACATATVTVSNGEDYWLPSSINKTGGFIQPTTIRNTTMGPLIEYEFDTFYWKEVNPSDGVFNFSVFYDALAKVRSGTNKRGLVTRFKVSVVNRKTSYSSGDAKVPFIPPWVLTTCNPKTCYTHGSSGSPQFMQYAALWDTCVQAKYKLMVTAFVNAGILQDPLFTGMYIGGISTSSGEEFSMSSSSHIGSCEDAGMSASVLEAAIITRLNAWHTALSDNQSIALMGKLVFVGKGWFGSAPSGDDYNRPVTQTLMMQSYALGYGYRTGGLEEFLGAFTRAIRKAESSSYSYFDAYFTKYDMASGWIDLWDEGFVYSPRRPGVFLGGEIEQISAGRGVPHFESSMWIENWLETKFVWVPNENFLKNLSPNNVNFLRWWLRTAGRRRLDRPDAAVWLRENWVKGGSSSSCFPVRNVGMAMNQTNSLSTPATLLYDRSVVQHGSFSKDCGAAAAHVDFLARRTSIASMVRHFSFALMPPRSSMLTVGTGFYSSSSSLGNYVCVFVTYAISSSSASCDFSLEDSNDAVLGGVSNQCSAGVFSASTATYNEIVPLFKTAKFNVSSSSLTQEFKIRLASGATTDLVVKMVRVVRNCEDNAGDVSLSPDGPTNSGADLLPSSTAPASTTMGPTSSASSSVFMMNLLTFALLSCAVALCLI